MNHEIIKLNSSRISIERTFGDIREEVRQMVKVSLDKQVKAKYHSFNLLLENLKKYITINDFIDKIENKADIQMV